MSVKTSAEILASIASAAAAASGHAIADAGEADEAVDDEDDDYEPKPSKRSCNGCNGRNLTEILTSTLFHHSTQHGARHKALLVLVLQLMRRTMSIQRNDHALSCHAMSLISSKHGCSNTTHGPTRLMKSVLSCVRAVISHNASCRPGLLMHGGG